jgi:hypothetical protein
MADASVAGAVINSTTTGTTSATGLTLTAQAADGTVTALIAGATGGGITGSNATLGVVGLANTSTFTLPIPGQSGFQNASTVLDGGGSGIVGYNLTDADNQFSGYFYGNKTNKSLGSGVATGVLCAINDIRSAIATGGGENGQPSAGFFRLYDNVSAAYAGSPAAPTAVYAEMYSASDNSKINGIVTHVETTADGDAGSQAVGLFSYTVGNNSTVVANKRVMGVAGWADASNTTSTYNLIGVVGGTDPYGLSAGGAVPRSIGGYFFGKSAASANLGSVAQVGGSTHQAWEDAAFTGMNVAVVGMNYNTPDANNLAGYFGGAVTVAGGVLTQSSENLVIAAGGPYTLSGNSNVYELTGTPGSDQLVSLPVGAAGQVIYILNSTDNAQTINGTSRAIGVGVAYAKFATFGWKLLFTF